MARAFIIRGFGKKKDGAGREYDFERVQNDLIDPALAACGLSGGTTATEEDPGNIREDMFKLILEAEVVICDITVHNANVFYELGIRHSLRKKHTVLLRAGGSADVTPFDLSTDRYLAYTPTEPGAALADLTRALQSALRSPRETDSPVFLLVPSLQEQSARGVAPLPLDLADEIQLAEDAKDTAWLRVIAEDIRGQRFERDALPMLARSQWSLKDLDGAQASWEAVRANAGDDDVESNLALANIYERQFRASRRETLLTASNQAIQKVIAGRAVAAGQRAEALALHARNAKTLWRARFERPEITDPGEARKLALDGKAIAAYDDYCSAFQTDLNNYYPGIAGLQMGIALRALADLPTWPNLFRGDKKAAQRRREDLDEELVKLRHIVEASVRRAVDQAARDLEVGDRTAADRKLWADITNADLTFLNLPDEQWQADPGPIVQAYVDAVPAGKTWAFDSARDQLRLFETLGIRAPAARAVIEQLGREAATRTHLVVFCGHAMDRPGGPRRFPVEAENKARQLIGEQIQALQAAQSADEKLVLLASAAPGADILAHEVAQALGLADRWLCLPMPWQDVARQVFDGMDGWRARFHAVVTDRKDHTKQLSDHAELPRWLQGRGLDVWSRGNRWVLKLAETWGADRVTFLALWDGKDDGNDGGTAQMVRLANEVGAFVVRRIDAGALLA